MQGTMNRAHQLINGIAGNGKENQRGERLKHVQHPQRGTYKTEQRTATIKQPTALQWAAMGGNWRQCKAMQGYEPRSST